MGTTNTSGFGFTTYGCHTGRAHTLLYVCPKKQVDKHCGSKREVTKGVVSPEVVIAGLILIHQRTAVTTLKWVLCRSTITVQTTCTQMGWSQDSMLPPEAIRRVGLHLTTCPQATGHVRTFVWLSNRRISTTFAKAFAYPKQPSAISSSPETVDDSWSCVLYGERTRAHRPHDLMVSWSHATERWRRRSVGERKTVTEGNTPSLRRKRKRTVEWTDMTFGLVPDMCSHPPQQTSITDPAFLPSSPSLTPVPHS